MVRFLMTAAVFIFSLSSYSSQQKYDLTGGHGIVYSSSTLSLFRSPATLGQIKGSRFKVGVDSGGADLDPMNISVFFNGGSRKFSFGLGFRNVDASSDTRTAYGGLALPLFSGVRVGASVAYQISGSAATPFDVNAGLMFGSSDKFQAALTVISLIDGIDTYGLGLAIKMGRIRLIADLTSNSSFGSIGILPAFVVEASKIAFNFGFGLASTASVQGVPKGIVFGLFYKLSNKAWFRYQNRAINAYHIELGYAF